MSILSVLVGCMPILYLARLLENAESDTEGPHMGNIPLQRVLAFWRVALSHSSRDRANLSREREREGNNGKSRDEDGRCMYRRLSTYLMAEE